MPLFMCSECGCVDNTAVSGFWSRYLEALEKDGPHKHLCSLCNPAIAKWHDRFPRKLAQGYMEDRSGFIYTSAEAHHYYRHLGPFHLVVLPESCREPR